MSTWERIALAYLLGFGTLPALVSVMFWYDARAARALRAKERAERDADG